VVATGAHADALPEISPADFDRLLAAIKPQPGESPWREIPWLTNVTEARRKASAEDKPLVIFTAADGRPLARTWGACTSNRARWFTGTQVEPEYVARHFVPLALDTYFRGNSHELEFCQKVRAGGNHLVVATAGGRTVGKGALRLRKKDLEGVLKEYARLPRAERTPAMPDPAEAQPPRRAVPRPPANGLIVRGYCTYLRHDDNKRVVRSGEYYYKENPDRWLAETQSDLLWLTESEWKSLVPANPRPGDRNEVARAIQKRFYSTIGIDYMEGSVSALPTRKTTMS